MSYHCAKYPCLICGLEVNLKLSFIFLSKFSFVARQDLGSFLDLEPQFFHIAVAASRKSHADTSGQGQTLCSIFGWWPPSCLWLSLNVVTFDQKMIVWLQKVRHSYAKHLTYLIQTVFCHRSSNIYSSFAGNSTLFGFADDSIGAFPAYLIV